MEIRKMTLEDLSQVMALNVNVFRIIGIWRHIAMKLKKIVFQPCW